jgi:hydrogenase maturation factor
MEFRCPKCGSTLTKTKSKLVCENENCDYQEKVISKMWYEELAENSNIWCQEAYCNFPSVIAHEYKRYNDMLMKGEIYGAFLQIKDLYEVKLKFPILIKSAEIYHKENRKDEENKILLSLLCKPLALGDWLSIGRTICSINNSKDEKILEILKDVIKRYEDEKIVNWRNDKIAHGALQFDIDDEFINDIKKKTEMVEGDLSRILCLN